ncbi:MAG: hypothetical protein EBY55_02200 [Gammaproteobacteria bacterium]|nr:hypothetical protein [Gammaproteobacteria bacterium]
MFASSHDLGYFLPYAQHGRLIALMRPALPDYLKPWIIEPMEPSKQAQGTLANDLEAHPTSVDHSKSASFDETSCRAIELV